METISLPIYNSEGQEVDKVKLNSTVFGGVINEAAIQQTVRTFMASQRFGLAATKTRGEVSGGGRKPWRQKGTGRARVGSTRSPLWRHGGVVFGPHPRNFSFTLPEKIKKLALKSALCLKLKQNNLIVLEKFTIDKPKTKEVSKLLVNLKISPYKNLLLLLDKIDGNLKLALRNIETLDFNLAKDTHTYEVLRHHKLLITKDALAALTQRLTKDKK